jgi:DNA-directed RNA polymerase subunit F
MDVKQFEDSRNAELEAFHKKYAFLKSEYSTALSSAITESDIPTRETLISRILTLNAEMTDELRTILTDLNKGTDKFNPRKIDDLMKELITYQKEHQEIEQSQDKLQTLKRIKGTTKERLEEASLLYNFYLLFLVLFAFVIVYLIMRTSWSPNAGSLLTKIVGQG